MKKISVIGAGHVGATTALYILEKKLGPVVLVDIVEGMPTGKALDMLEAAPLRGYDIRLQGGNDFSAIKGSDLVVVTAGMPRKPGMSRDDLLKVNADITENIARQVKEYAPNAIVMVITNPLDLMCYVMLKVTGFDSKRVMGMAGVLDSTRMRYFIAEQLGLAASDVTAFVLGGHGDTMVPLPEYTTVGGIPAAELIDQATLDKIVERTRKGGGEIVSYLKTGSAYYAPAASVAEMVEAVVTDRKRILPVSAYLNGQYGYKDMFLGVPVLLGKDGVEKVIELKLAPETKKALDVSAEHVKTNIEKWGALKGAGAQK